VAHLYPLHQLIPIDAPSFIFDRLRCEFSAGAAFKDFQLRPFSKLWKRSIEFHQCAALGTHRGKAMWFLLKHILFLVPAPWQYFDADQSFEAVY